MVGWEGTAERPDLWFSFLIGVKPTTALELKPSEKYKNTAFATSIVESWALHFLATLTFCFFQLDCLFSFSHQTELAGKL